MSSRTCSINERKESSGIGLLEIQRQRGDALSASMWRQNRPAEFVRAAVGCASACPAMRSLMVLMALRAIGISAKRRRLAGVGFGMTPARASVGAPGARMEGSGTVLRADSALDGEQRGGRPAGRPGQFGEMRIRRRGAARHAESVRHVHRVFSENTYVVMVNRELRRIKSWPLPKSKALPAERQASTVISCLQLQLNPRSLGDLRHVATARHCDFAACKVASANATPSS